MLDLTFRKALTMIYQYAIHFTRRFCVAFCIREETHLTFSAVVRLPCNCDLQK